MRGGPGNRSPGDFCVMNESGVYVVPATAARSQAQCVWLKAHLLAAFLAPGHVFNSLRAVLVAVERVPIRCWNTLKFFRSFVNSALSFPCGFVYPNFQHSSSPYCSLQVREIPIKVCDQLAKGSFLNFYLFSVWNRQFSCFYRLSVCFTVWLLCCDWKILKFIVGVIESSLLRFFGFNSLEDYLLLLAVASF